MDLLVCLLFGLAIGSFLNVCIARLPHYQSVVHPRSRCPKCLKLIAWYDNVPVLSYVLLGGRCRYCRKRISWRYPAVELLTGGVSVLIGLKFGFSLEWGVYLVFAAALVILAFIDVDHRILPDAITLNGIWAGVIVSVILAMPSPFLDNLLNHVGYGGLAARPLSLIGSIVGALVGGGLLWLVGEAYYRVRGIEGMGFGDVKMMAMVGAFLGAPLALLTIMMGSVLGALIGVGLIKFGGKHRNYELPFGTFLSLAGIIALLYGDSLIHWYFVHMIQPVL
jgi:leader peptidase (prepilin peptidase) / N-methyltransferase